MKNSRIIVLVLACFSLAFSTAAQDTYPVITAENIHQLHSVTHIDFDKWEEQVAKIDNGWFALNQDGSRMAVLNRSGEITIGDATGKIVDLYSVLGSDNLPTSVLDVAFRVNDSAVVSAHVEGGVYYVAYDYYQIHRTEYFRFDSPDVPLRIWESGSVWLEVSPADYTRGRYVQHLTPSEFNGFRTNEVMPPDSVHELDSGPENDPDSFLRIGRIDPPFAVTVTQNFLVKRWNLETGKVTATAQLDELPGAGQLSTDGHFFAWRDGESKALHLLAFDSGKDQIVAILQGSYIPYLLLNSSASVIIGVNVASKPVVVAWDTKTGQRIELGEYRPCTRQPDMVRLSHDSTTLVIGCDKGLDVWRVSP
ncbi:MAG: hypothetical protein H0X30_06555 [Anaerolineae bacterium]|nr:hypothetical protein [Anaerolineae bacterium]